MSHIAPKTNNVRRWYFEPIYTLHTGDATAGDDLRRGGSVYVGDHDVPHQLLSARVRAPPRR